MAGELPATLIHRGSLMFDGTGADPLLQAVLEFLVRLREREMGLIYSLFNAYNRSPVAANYGILRDVVQSVRVSIRRLLARLSQCCRSFRTLQPRPVYIVLNV